MLYFVYGSLKTRVKKQVSIIIDSIFKDEEKNVVELDFNECDIFSIEDKTISLSSEEFQKYGDLKEEYFGILIKKNSNDFLIGSCDLCGCKIDSSFRQIKKSEDNFYKTINNIIESNIIY